MNSVESATLLQLIVAYGEACADVEYAHSPEAEFITAEKYAADRDKLYKEIERRLNGQV